MSSIFNLGEVVKSFARSRPAIIDSYLPGGYDTVRDLNKTLDTNRTANQGDLSSYLSAFGAATPQFNSLNQGGIDYLGDLLKKPVDGSASYRDLLGFNLDKLNSQQNVLDQAGARADNIALAGLGLGGRSGGGSYGSLARTNRISANTVPILNTIFGNTGQTAQSISDQNYRQTLLNLGLLDKRLGMVDNPANRLLAPSGVRNAMLSNDTGLLNGIVNAMKNNVAGMRENPSGVERWGNAIGAVDKSLNSALDTYLSLYSGGAMGGSGLFGMSGTTPSNKMPSMNQQGQGGGGGINIQQLMAMLNQRGGNQYGGGYSPVDYSTGETMPSASSFYYP